MNLTKYEKYVIAIALEERADSLKRYVSWINDRPMLPERQIAIDQVEKEGKTCDLLRFYFNTGERL